MTTKAPDIICAGEMLVEIMRAEPDVPHAQVGAVYRGPFPSGAPAIFVDAAARMAETRKLTAGLVGVIGNDDFGHLIVNKLDSDGADVSSVRIDNRNTTGVAFVQYNRDGSRQFIFSPGAAGQLTESDMTDEYFAHVRCFHVMGSALAISDSSRRAVMKAIELTQRAGGLISFDPNLRPEMMPLTQILAICEPVIRKTRILLPNAQEAMMLTGRANARDACASLLGQGPEIVVLKEAKNGCTLYACDEAIRVSAYEVDEVDPTGAGDSFAAAFIVEYLSGASWKDAARFANAVGALKVMSFGPMSSHLRKEVEQFMAGRGE
ncbi:MAG: sugar kinase [Acidobacteria bacterium]|nr:MAG: sugar kinase [Acidobacteriota bacterium]